MKNKQIELLLLIEFYGILSSSEMLNMSFLLKIIIYINTFNLYIIYKTLKFLFFINFRDVVFIDLEVMINWKNYKKITQF